MGNGGLWSRPGSAEGLLGLGRTHASGGPSSGARKQATTLASGVRGGVATPAWVVRKQAAATTLAMAWRSERWVCMCGGGDPNLY